MLYIYMQININHIFDLNPEFQNKIFTYSALSFGI